MKRLIKQVLVILLLPVLIPLTMIEGAIVLCLKDSEDAEDRWQRSLFDRAGEWIAK